MTFDRAFRFKLLYEFASPIFVFLLNILLIYPLFTGEFTQHVGSIEAAFISDARFVDQNGFANWNPLWYGGFPFHLSYVPLIPFLTLIPHLLSPAISLPQSYRIITALAYAFGPVTLFFFVKYLTQRESTALATAIIYSVVLMPIYSAIPSIGALALNFEYVPYTLLALMLFGEGPHVLGLTLIPLAALAFLRLLRSPSFKGYVVASLAVSAVALANTIALYALGILSVILLLSEVLKGERMKKARTAVTCGMLSYGLVAFSYDPSFVNAPMSVGLFGFTWQNLGQMMLIVGPVLSILFAYFRKKPELQHLLIAYAWTAVFFIVVAVGHFFEIPFAPQPTRYVPELNIGVSILLGIAVTQFLGKFPRTVPARINHMWKPLLFFLVIVVILVLPFTRSTWKITAPNQGLEETPEYNLAKWLEAQEDEHRVFATGTICFWLNVFGSVPQLRGGADGASMNPWSGDVTWELDNGDNGRLGVLLSQALNLRYVVVIYPNADTPYHDSAFPNKFDGILPLRYSYKGFGIFEVPLTHSELIQPIDTNALQDLTINGVQDIEGLTRYVDAVENPPLATCSYRFVGTDRCMVEVANATESTGILVKMTFDERWKASVNGLEVPISKIGPSFTFLRPNMKGNYELELICGKTASEIIGSAISVATLVLLSVFSVYTVRKTEKNS